MNDASTKRHSRKGLYAPFIIVLVALAAWTGWWFYLTRQIETRLDAQAETLRRAGWSVDYVKDGITGWPFRAHLKLKYVEVAAPSGHAVAAPALSAEANAYQPTKWVVVAPDGLVLTRAERGKVAVRGDAIRMSVHGLTQAWPNVALELVNPVFTAHEGAEIFPISRAGRVEFYIRPHIVGSTVASDDVDMLFRLIDAKGRPDGPVEAFTQDGLLTIQTEAVIGQASALHGMDAAGVLSAWARAGGTFRQVRGEMAAGESRATLTSDLLRARPDGRLEGRVALKTIKPLPALAGLAGTPHGAVNRVGAAGAAGAAAAAGATGAGDELDLTVVFRDGRTWLGPFSIAPAPKLF